MTPKFALKLLQIGQVSAADSADPQVRAVLGGETVAGYVALPGFASYGNGHGVLASAELELGNFDAARVEILSALRKRPKDDTWRNALDTIILATTNMRAGEVREGIQDTQRALVLVREVGSRTLRDRLMSLADELDRRNNSYVS